MSEKVDLKVTDFQKIRSSMSPTVNDRKSNGFIVVVGDCERMNNTDPSEESVNGITHIIANKYCRDRYFHIVTISLYDKTDNFIDLDINVFSEIMDKIDDIYMREEVPVLFINIIPREIYLNIQEGNDRYADEATNLLKRYGYLDISCDYTNNIGNYTIPKYVMIRTNDIGSSMIMNNLKEFW